MTIKNDLSEVLARRSTKYGFTSEESHEIVKIVIDALDDHNLADAYADHNVPEDERDIESHMDDYWSVVRFLKIVV